MRNFILLAVLGIMSLNLSGCGGVFEKARQEAINDCMRYGKGYSACFREVSHL